MKRKALGAIDRIDRLDCKTVGERDSWNMDGRLPGRDDECFNWKNLHISSRLAAGPIFAFFTNFCRGRVLQSPRARKISTTIKREKVDF